MFVRRRGISLFGTNTYSCGLSLSGINYASGTNITSTSFSNNSTEYFRNKRVHSKTFYDTLDS